MTSVFGRSLRCTPTDFVSKLTVNRLCVIPTSKSLYFRRLVLAEIMILPVVELDGAVSDWVILEAHEV